MTNILSGKILVPKLWVKCSQPIILQKDVRGEFDFLHEDTQQSVLQADIVFARPKVLKIASFQYLCNISRKKVMVSFIFYLQINSNFLYKLRLSVLVDMTSHAQST